MASLFPVFKNARKRRNHNERNPNETQTLAAITANRHALVATALPPAMHALLFRCFVYFSIILLLLCLHDTN